MFVFYTLLYVCVMVYVYLRYSHKTDIFFVVELLHRFRFPFQSAISMDVETQIQLNSETER